MIVSAFFEQIVDDADLIGHLRAAEDGHKRALRILERLAHDGQLLLDQQSGIRGQIRRNTGGGSVRAVHRAERIGDIDLRHGGKLLGKFGVIFLLAGIKTQVLQQQELARAAAQPPWPWRPRR